MSPQSSGQGRDQARVGGEMVCASAAVGADNEAVEILIVLLSFLLRGP